MTDDLIARARAALDGVTPGPWEWGGTPDDIRLQTVHGGKVFVMTFARKGMRGAQPCFQPNGHGMVPADELLQFQVGDKTVVGEKSARANDSVYRYDVRGIDAPDAHFIAAARDLVPALVDEVERLGKQCEGLMQAAMNNGQALILAEAKVEKLFKALQAICATAHADDYAGWRTALEEATAALAEIGGYQK